MYSILQAYRALLGLRKLPVMKQLFAGFLMIWRPDSTFTFLFVYFGLLSSWSFVFYLLVLGGDVIELWCFELDLVFHCARRYVVIVRTNEFFFSPIDGFP